MNEPSEKLDRRVRKTKESINQALLTLLDKEPIEHISITALCNAADINRSTFYAHYSSPEDCYQQMTNALFARLLEQFKTCSAQSLMEYVEIYLRFMKSHQVVFKSLHRTSIDNPIFHQLFDSLFPYMRDETSKYKSSLFYRYHFYGFFGIIAEWLNNNCNEDIEDILSFFKNELI